MRKIKWGVIGCGGIADRRTLPAIMNAKNAELIAVMDVNGEVANIVKKNIVQSMPFQIFTIC